MNLQLNRRKWAFIYCTGRQTEFNHLFTEHDKKKWNWSPPVGACVTEALLLRPGVVEPVELVDNGDQTHTVNYVPTREGPYSINVLYADEEIPRRSAQTQTHC